MGCQEWSALYNSVPGIQSNDRLSIMTGDLEMSKGSVEHTLAKQ